MDETKITVGMSHQAHIILDHRHRYTYMSEEIRKKAISEAKEKLMLWMGTQDNEEVERLIAHVRTKAKTILPGGRVVDTYPIETSK